MTDTAVVADTAVEEREVNRSPVNANARARYLAAWRPAAKKPKKVNGLRVPLVELADGHIDELRELSAMPMGTPEWEAAIADHLAGMKERQARLDDLEDEADRLRGERGVEMMALVLLGMTSAAVARECRSRRFPRGVGPMVVGRAIGTTSVIR